MHLYCAGAHAQGQRPCERVEAIATYLQQRPGRPCRVTHEGVHGEAAGELVSTTPAGHSAVNVAGVKYVAWQKKNPAS